MSADPAYPIRIVVAESAWNEIWRTVHREYEERQVAWAGLLWGTVYRAPNREMVPVVHRVTEGVCRATATTCELLPESWTEGRERLPAGSDWVNVGDYRSHPDSGVFMRPEDSIAFWSKAKFPYWVGCVIDPVRRSFGFFAKDSQTSSGPIRAWRVADDRLT